MGENQANVMSTAAERRQARRTLWEELSELPETREEEEKLPTWTLPIAKDTDQEESWLSIGQTVDRCRDLPNSGHFNMPEEVLPIAHVEGSVPKPAKKKETKAAATMTLLRRLLAADLVLGNAIRKLDLAGHGIGDEGCVAVAEVLLAGARVETLDLRNNGIADTGAASLATAIEVSSTLKHCVLCNNKIGPAGAVSLTAAFKYSSTIEEWDLSSNPIGNDGLKVFLQGFLVNRVVTVLAIRDTMLEDDGCDMLGNSSWGGLSKLSELDVSGNQLGPQGCASLCRMMMRRCSVLAVLDLRDNVLGDESGKCIAKALSTNPVLQTLCLARCAIGDAGVCAIADALDSDSTLRALDLKLNLFGDSAGVGLATALARCTSLLLLDMTSEKTTNDTWEVVVVAIRTIPAERKLTVHLMTGAVIRGRADANKFTLPEDGEDFDEDPQQYDVARPPISEPPISAAAPAELDRPVCARTPCAGGCSQQ